MQHKDLTGSDLHEPKGCSTATAGQVYIADGAGSGTWQNPLSGVNNLNEFEHSVFLEDISEQTTTYIRVGRDSTLTNLLVVIDGAITGSDATISIHRDGILLGQSMTIPVAGSGEGVKLSLNLSPSYDFAEGQVLKISSNGVSTGTVRAFITAKFTAT